MALLGDDLADGHVLPAVHCSPVGALIVKDDTDAVLDALSDENKHVVAQLRRR